MPLTRSANRSAHRRRPARLTLSLALASAFAPAAALWSLDNPAHAQAAPIRFDIAAGPLDTVIGQFGRAANVAVAADPRLTQGLSSTGLTGPYELAPGLAALLNGTGLTAESTGNGFTLRRLAGGIATLAPAIVTGQPSSETIPRMPSVQVAGHAETANGSVFGYVARRSATGTKTDTPIVETPQSLSVVTSDDMQARGAASVTEAIRYVPGVVAEGYGQDDTGYEWHSIRGFGASSYLDGLRQLQVSYISPQNEPYGLERVEVLRGPTSVLYGQGDAGGVIARISKRPQANHSNEVRAGVGNFRSREIAADLGGKLSQDGRLLVRVVALGRTNQPQNDYPGYAEPNVRRFFLAPSLSWQPSQATSVTLLPELLNVDSGSNASEYLGPGQQRSGVLVGDPSFDRVRKQQRSLGYQFEHRVNEQVTIRQHARQGRYDNDNRYNYGSSIESADAEGNVSREAVQYVQSLHVSALDNQVQGRFQSGSLEHQLLVGVDWLKTDYLGKRLTGPGVPLNLRNPAYGVPIAPRQTLGTSEQDVQRQTGIYVQDQIRIGPQWRVSAGLRHDTVRTRNHNYLIGSTTTLKDNALTTRLGVTYLLPGGMAPYASYTESFLPETGTTFAGDSFKPSRGRQYEVGVKFQPANGAGLVTASVFDLTKRNVSTPDPANFGYSIQTGEVRSRGLELEAKVALARGLDMTAQFTLNHQKVTKSHDADLGKRPVNMPRHLASAWIDYRIQQGSLDGLGLGLGVRHVGKRYADADNRVGVPAHTLVDAALRFDASVWSTVLSVNNLFDKDYVSTYAYGYYPGVRRTVNLTTSYRF